MSSSKKEVRFYRCDTPENLPDFDAASAGVCARLWRPESAKPGPDVFMGSIHILYNIFHKTGIFSNREYSALCLDDLKTHETLHVSTIFPRFFRFPFMAENDLQIGATFTRDDARGRGLGRIALVSAAKNLAKPGRVFWYVTETSNIASCKVAERSGFALFGTGTKEPLFGLSAFGSYRISNTHNEVSG